MADRYQIRHASAADLPEIAAIEQAVFPDPWSPAMLRQTLDGLALVAMLPGGAVVGYLFATAAADEAEILNLAVQPAHRRRGVARLLTESALAELREIGARRVFLEVRESNVEAQRFYEIMGFRWVGRRRGYYRHPREDALLLARRIEGDRGPA